jgi:hypothetical protein
MRRCMFVAAVAALVLLAPSVGWAQNPGRGAEPGTAFNLKRVGHDPLFSRGMNAAIAVYGNFLYVGNRTDSSPGHVNPGILVVDIANARKPRVVAQLPPEPAGQTTRELRVWPQQKLLMVMIFRCSSVIHACPAGTPPDYSIKFYDLTNPYVPQLVSTYVPSRQPHEMYLWLDPRRPGRALLYMSTPSGSADPARPNLIVTDISGWRSGAFPELASWTANHLFTQQQRDTLDVALHSMSVTDDGTRLYLAYLGGGFFVADTSDLANGVTPPQVRLLTPIAATPRWPNQTVHSAIPLPGRTYALTTDELYGDLLDGPDNDHGCPWGWSHSIDVSDPANPRLVGEYRSEANVPAFCATPEGANDERSSHTAHNPTVFPNLALISWHGSGLQAIDVRNPGAPRQAGWYTPVPLPSVATEDPGLTTTGNRVAMWSFPIVRNGLIWVLDIRNGLYSLRYRGPGRRTVDRTIFREGNSNLRATCRGVLTRIRRPERLVAGRRARLAVTVRLFGQPVENARVGLRGAGVFDSSSTDERGRAAVAFTPARRGRITASATNVARHCAVVVGRVRPGR